MRGKYTPADGVQSRGVSTTTRSGDRGAGESDWGVGRGGGGGGARVVSEKLREGAGLLVS